MPTLRVLNLGQLNTYINPLEIADGEMIRSVNIDTDGIGAKKRRNGYVTYQGTADGSAVRNLFSWAKDDGTTLFTYRVSGTQIYYSTQGTSDWVACGNGGINGTAHIGYTVLNNTLILGDGIGSTRHTTNGTSFTNTTIAPIGEFFATSRDQRVYIGGTASTLFYSTAGDATNWQTSGTSDSSSINIPGAGKINQVFFGNNRINVSKNSSGIMYRWDSYNLTQVPTNQALSSPYSLAQIEDYWLWLNRNGVQGYNGDRPNLISNPIRRQIWNDDGNGIPSASFGTAPAGAHRYDYFLSMGTVTDDLTQETVANAIGVYKYQTNEWLNFKFNDFPTCYHSYVDTFGARQLIFGNSTGQVFTYSGTATSDNESAIESVAEFVIHGGVPEKQKKFNWFWPILNPGCEARIQFAISDTFVKGKLNWQDLGDVKQEIKPLRFPEGSRGRLLFIKIVDASKTSRFDFYGYSVDVDLIGVA